MRITGGIPVGGNLGFFNGSFGFSPMEVPMQITPSLVENVQDRFEIAGFLPYTPFNQKVNTPSWRSIYKFAHEDVNPHSLY